MENQELDFLFGIQQEKHAKVFPLSAVPHPLSTINYLAFPFIFLMNGPKAVIRLIPKKIIRPLKGQKLTSRGKSIKFLQYRQEFAQILKVSFLKVREAVALKDCQLAVRLILAYWLLGGFSIVTRIFLPSDSNHTILETTAHQRPKRRHTPLYMAGFHLFSGRHRHSRCPDIQKMKNSHNVDYPYMGFYFPMRS